MAALQILCHNDNSTYVLKHEEKNCEITLETQEGHSVQWSRKKSGSPKYLINGKTFDRLKGGVPAELHKALRLGRVTSEKSEFDVHIGEQKKPIFLLNDSPRAAAEFFASSSDAIRLVEMQGLHKAKVRDAKKDKIRLDAEIQEIESSLETLEPVTKLSKELEKCEKAFYEINLAESEYETLAKKISKIEWLLNQIDFLEQQEQTLSQLEPLPILEDSARLEKLANNLRGVKLERERLELVESCLLGMQSPPELADDASLSDHVADLEVAVQTSLVLEKKSEALGHLSPLPALSAESELEVLVNRLERLTHQAVQLESQANSLDNLQTPPVVAETTELAALIVKLESENRTLQKLDQEMGTITGQLNDAGMAINDWVAQNPTCPTCRRPMNDEFHVSMEHQCGGGDG